jgi:hypothetical protein
MITVKVISNSFNKIKQRLVKAYRYGKNDVVETEEMAPAGIDGNPIKDMIAIYADTASNSAPVIIGYIQKEQLAEPGELRIYSQNSSGQAQAYVWLKTDGNIEFNGNTNNLVKFTELNTALQAYKKEIDIQLNKIAPIVNLIAPGTFPVLPIDSTMNIDQAKAEKLKTE